MVMAENNHLPPRPKRIPPHILRRRRIVAVIILLILLGLIGWGIWALVGLFTSDDEQPPPVTETVSPAPTETATEDNEDDEKTAETANACDPQVLALAGATDQESYAEGEFPVFTMTIAHEGDELCDASVGTDAQNFVVEDADGEFVFSTRSCQVEPQSQVVEMEPGQSESAEFQWERVGTDEECETTVEDIEAGEYQLIVGLGEQTAEPVTFELE